MMSIKTDDFRLNKILTSDQNSENKTVFSKKELLPSANLELSNIEGNDFSTENISKIKQKLEDFYNLEHGKNVDSKHNLKIKSKDKKDKDTEYDCLNIEGLLLTQRKVYSQICDCSDRDKIEKKPPCNNITKKTFHSNENIIENDLNLINGFRVNDEENIYTHNDKKKNNIILNELGLIKKDNEVNLKVEKIEGKYQNSKVLESNESRKGKKNEPYKKIERVIESKVTLKNNEIKLNIEDGSISIEHDLIKNKKYLNGQKIDDKYLSFNIKKQNFNIEKIHQEKIKEDVSDIPIFNSINPEYQKIIPKSLSNKQIIDIPALSLLHKNISTLTQPSSITYVFKKWGSEFHQIKMKFDTDKKSN